jgi:ribonuclease HI
LSIILDENNKPLLEGKNISLSLIFESLAKGKSLKEVCSLFSLTDKELKAVFRYAAGAVNNEPSQKSSELLIYTDGASRGNPGEAGIGIVFCNEQGELLKEVSEYIGVVTNNVAEYRALIKALIVAADEWGQSKIKIFTDSELMARQMSGHYKVKNEELKELFCQARELSRKFKKMEIHHIEREKNKQADKLANIAINLK